MAGLTNEQRVAWKAATDYFPYQDKLGQTKQYSGAQLYGKLNGGIRSATPAATLLTDPPSAVSIPALTVTNFEVGNDAGDMKLTGTFAPTTVPANCVLMVYTTDGVSAGISSPQNSAYKLLGRIAAAATIGTQLAVLDGDIPTAAVGTKMFLSMTLISTVTGQMSEVLNASAIVAAL